MSEFQLRTPVAFIIFNRPDTTERVFAEIAKAKPPKLLVIGDGARSNHAGEAEKVAATRAIINRIDWDCEVLTNFSEVNLGCKNRVSSGIDWVFEQVEEAIILEDDCLPHPSFFNFCEVMLCRYKDDTRVMMIGGTNYLLDRLEIDESYCFSRYFAIWGWATWRSAWNKYDISMKNWSKLKCEDQVSSFYGRRYMKKYLTTIFDEVHKRGSDTWDIQWFYSCLFNNSLSIVPRVNLISNIGLIGTHTSADVGNNLMPVFALDMADVKHPELVYPNQCYDDEFFNEKLKNSLLIRLKALVKRICLN